MNETDGMSDDIVATFPPVHPGEIPREEFIESLGLTPGRVEGVRYRAVADRRLGDRNQWRYGDTARPVFQNLTAILDKSAATL